MGHAARAQGYRHAAARMGRAPSLHLTTVCSRAASCHWLRNNTALWTKWISNTREPRPFPFWIFVAVAAALLGLLVAVGVVWLYKRHTRETRELQSSPSGDCVTVMFTDIQGSTALWDSLPQAMAEALETHNSLIRVLLFKYQGYEVKTIGDAFMIAFPRPELAVQCSADIQTKLVQVVPCRRGSPQCSTMFVWASGSMHAVVGCGDCQQSSTHWDWTFGLSWAGKATLAIWILTA